MEITMSKTAAKALIEKVGEHSKIAIALIDHSDPFLREKSACAKGAFFRSSRLLINLANISLESIIHY